KKNETTMTIVLDKTTDILAQLGQQKQHQFLIGFAAETHDIEKYARGKLTRKKADMIVANDVSKSYAGFNKDTNEVTIFMPEEQPVEISVRSKQEIAIRIFEEAIKRMKK
ncbi:phosphopantothenoylcysteine decarboxylase, partial [Carnobacterium sp.]|uniref:phosphopantothenoylcysteine decarboxylase domain-containing protein n=1 Tax=Carnobacterium sp. TaxID=48221 RepID=UPI0028AE7456